MVAEFPIDPKGYWGSLAEQERWRTALEKVGPENARARLAQSVSGSSSSMAIGCEVSMTKGFVEEWLNWHDQRARDADEAYRAHVARWAKAAALGALVTAVATTLQAVFGFLSLPKL